MLTPSLSITDQLLISLSRKSIMMQAAALSLQLFVIAVALQCCLLPNRQAVAAQEQNDVAAAAAAATTQRYSAEPRHGGSLVPPPRGHSCMATSSRPVHRLKVEGKVFCLRLPRVLKNPPVDVTGTKKFVRTYNDTCGLYGVVFSTFVPAGAGPPPHVHFAEDEWWIPTTPGDKVRLHAQAADAGPLKQYKAGQVPGYNLPPLKVGGVEVPYGSIGYSPAFLPHTYKGATNLTNFWAVWGFGWAMIPGVNIPEAAKPGEEARVLEQTGIWGVPTDLTNSMFDPVTFVTDARKPVALPPVKWENVQRLQNLFDQGERCYPDAD